MNNVMIHRARNAKVRETFRDYLTHLVSQGVVSYNDLNLTEKQNLTAYYFRDCVDYYDQAEEIMYSDYGKRYPKIFIDLLLGQLDITDAFLTIRSSMVARFEDRLCDEIEDCVKLFRRQQEDYWRMDAERNVMGL